MESPAAIAQGIWREAAELLSTPLRRALILPFALFMAWLGASGMISSVSGGHGSLFFATPQYWVYPVQTFSCGLLLWHYRRHYALRLPARPLFTLILAFLILVIWISPQLFFGAAPRTEGFDPEFFGNNPSIYYPYLAVRLLRSVVVVPFLEEIFWRAFLLRSLIDEHFERVPFGTYTAWSCAITTVCFAMEHWGEKMAPGPDVWTALAAGVLFNVVAYRTRSLSSCILAHAITNLLLDVYILHTRQWGFW